MDLFEPGSGSQVHDINGGIALNGRFWTVQLPGGAFSIDEDRTHATLRATGLPVVDSFQFAGANVVPATIDLDITWDATGPAENRGLGTTVPGTDPGAFRGLFAPATAVGEVSGFELGFSFRSDSAASADQAPEIGRERNGSFL